MDACLFLESTVLHCYSIRIIGIPNSRGECCQVVCRTMTRHFKSLGFLLLRDPATFSRYESVYSDSSQS